MEEVIRVYVTFGQTHVHSVGGKTLDKDCVAIVDNIGLDRYNDLVKLFGSKWARDFSEAEWDEKSMEYYPRGYIHVG